MIAEAMKLEILIKFYHSNLIHIMLLSRGTILFKFYWYNIHTSRSLKKRGGWVNWPSFSIFQLNILGGSFSQGRFLLRRWSYLSPKKFNLPWSNKKIYCKREPYQSSEILSFTQTYILLLLYYDTCF